MYEVNKDGIISTEHGWFEVYQKGIGTSRFRLDRVGECQIEDQDEEFNGSRCRYLTLKFLPVEPVENEWDSVVRIAFHGVTDAEEWMRENIPSVSVGKK